MSNASVPAVVPRSISSPVGQADARSRRRLPLPQLAALPSTTAMLYRIAAVDDRGRLADQAVLNALGWRAGQRLRIEPISTAAAAVQLDADGPVPLARRGHIPLPVTVRRWCGLHPGDRVLLAAAAEHQLLLIHTTAALDAMVTTFHTTTGRGEQP